MIRFTSVRLSSFGRFREAEFLFQPGMNLVHGNNEAGKSTLAAAMRGTIFGFRKDRERYNPWNSDRFQAEVVYVYGDREMTVTRDFSSDRVRATERSGNEIVWRFEGRVSVMGRSSDREEYLAKIEEVWGFSDGDIFRNSAFLGQRDLEIAGDSSMSSRLQQLLSGFTDVDYDAVIADLEKELYEITRRPGGRSKEKELELVRARLAELGSLWKKAKEALMELERRQAESDKLTSWLENSRRDLEKGHKYLDNIKKVQELMRRKQQLVGELDRVDEQRAKVEQLLRERELLEKKLPVGRLLNPLPDDFAATFRLFMETQANLRRLEEAVESAGDTPHQRETPAPVWAIAAGLVAWSAAGGLAYIHPRVAVAALSSAAVLAAIIIAAVIRRAQKRRAIESRHAGRRDALLAEIDRTRSDLAGIAARCPEVATIAAEEASSIVGTLNEITRVQQGLAQIDRALQVLPVHAEVVKQARELTREIATVEERVETIVASGLPMLSPEELLQAEERIQCLEREVVEKEKLCREQEQEIAVIRRTSLDLAVIEDEGEELREKEARLAKRAAALDVALKVLRESVDEYRATYLVRLSREVDRRVATVTSGNYREASFDADLNLFLSAGRELRPVEEMSCGVQDQAYLAARLALGGILSRRRELPFLLDDPLVNFDAERRAGTLQALALVSRDHQVILFTHDERYLKARGTERWHKILLRHGRVDDGQLHLL